MNLYETLIARELPGFFHWHWLRAEDWRRRLEQLEGRQVESRLVTWLEDYNRGLGAHPQALESLRQLREGAPVVVAGQQAGLLTGPLYTIYKALTAISQANKLGKSLGRPVVPIFWLASEDHDFAEVKAAWFPTANEPAELAFPGQYLLTPAARIPLLAEDTSYIISHLRELLPATEFTDEILQLVESSGRESITYAEWCARILCRLFSSRGLVIVDSTAPPLRWLARPVFQLTAQQGAQIHELIDQRKEKLLEQGFSPGLDIPRDHSHLFWLEGNSRTALLREQSRFSGRRGEISLTQSELLAAINDTPEHFSPNVVLRPLVQELAFPVLGMVVGPGEAAYMAQLPDVFALLGLQPPPLIPRLGGIILEPPIERLLTRYNLTIRDLPRLAQWQEEQLEAGAGGQARQEFAVLRATLTESWAKLEPLLVQLDPQLPLLADKNLAKVLEQVDWLEGRAMGAVRKSNELLLRHVRRLQDELAPPGGQERFYNIFWYLNKYGLDFLNTLAELEPGQEQVVRPGRIDQ